MSPMKRVIFRRWTVAVDVEATTKAYAGIERGDAERCGCTPCVNFVAAREQVYPRRYFDSSRRSVSAVAAKQRCSTTADCRTVFIPMAHGSTL